MRTYIPLIQVHPFTPILNRLSHQLQVIQGNGARKLQQLFAGDTPSHHRLQCLDKRQNLSLQVLGKSLQLFGDFGFDRTARFCAPVLYCRARVAKGDSLGPSKHDSIARTIISPRTSTNQTPPNAKLTGNRSESGGVTWTFALFQRVLGSASAFSRSMLIVVISSTMSSSVL